jgi:hypothetical protein
MSHRRVRTPRPNNPSRLPILNQADRNNPAF